MRSRILKAAKRLIPAVIGLPRKAASALGDGGANAEPHRARLWQAMAVILPIAGSAAVVLPRLTLVMSPSISAVLLREVPGVIHRGDLVTFFLSHPLAGPAPVRVTKYALCLPGEHIDWLEKPAATVRGAWEAWYYCEDRLLGITRPRGHDGRPLAYWRPTYRVIPAGFVYVGSAHPSGFDSRYYGPIPIARLTRMEKVL